MIVGAANELKANQSRDGPEEDDIEEELAEAKEDQN